MTDGEALLAAIRDDPADDTARLVYADFLQEQGKDDHAAMIRRQVSRGATVRYDWLGPVPTHRVGGGRPAEWCWTAGRPTRGDTNTIRGLLPNVPPPLTHFFRAEFARGFLFHLECTGLWWLHNADALDPCCGWLTILIPPPREETWANLVTFNAFELSFRLKGRDAIRTIKRPSNGLEGMKAVLEGEWPWVTFEFQRGQHTN